VLGGNILVLPLLSRPLWLDMGLRSTETSMVQHQLAVCHAHVEECSGVLLNSIAVSVVRMIKGKYIFLGRCCETWPNDKSI
jgi:hypothetical protein